MKTKLTLIVTAFVFCLQQGYGQEKAKPDLKKGLVAHYPFNGSGKDESGNGHLITVSGAVLTKDRHGQKQGAYSFEDRKEFTRTDWIKGSLEKYTFSIWVFPKEYKLDFELNTLISADLVPKPKGHMPWLGYSGIHRYIRLSYHSHSYIDTARGVIKYNQWSHLTGTFDGTNAKIYLNGRFLSERKAKKGSASISTQCRVYIGRYHEGNAGRLSGNVDDARIYNRALSAKEVKALYDLEKPKTK